MPKIREVKGWELHESDVVTVATTIDLAGLNATLPHNFAGVQFFSDAAGLVPATPGAGTVDITVQTINSQPAFEAVPNNTITGATPTTVSWDGNTQAIKAVPTGITTATHYKLVWTANES